MKRAVTAISDLYERARDRLRAQVTQNGKLDRQKLEQRQVAAHALAYLATELDGQPADAGLGRARGRRLRAGDRRTPISARSRAPSAARSTSAPCESFDVREFGISDEDLTKTVRRGRGARARGRGHAAPSAYLEIARARARARLRRARPRRQHARGRARRVREVRRRARDPDRAGDPPQGRADPDGAVEQMSELGVFGLTIPESYAGMGLSKVAMCVVTEELSRGYIGVGSLHTRNEIAAELIMRGGTEEQKQCWLPKLATRRGAADRRVHRAEQRLRPRAHHDARRAPGRRLVHGERRQDLDHPRRARRPDDAARAHQPERQRRSAASRCSSCPRRAVNGRAGQGVRRRGPDRHRDQGARLPRHEGVRALASTTSASRRARCSAARRARPSSS